MEKGYYVQIKKPSKGRAAHISKGISVLLDRLLDCSKKTPVEIKQMAFLVYNIYGLSMLIYEDETCPCWSVKQPLIFSIMEKNLACQ